MSLSGPEQKALSLFISACPLFDSSRGRGLGIWPGFVSFSGASRQRGGEAGDHPAFVQLVIPGCVYFFWRAWYFSEWLPLPFIVKSTGSRDWIFVFKGSVKNVAMAFLPGLLAGVFIENRRLYFTRVMVLFSFPIIFYCCMRLEQNLGNRFLAPLFFGSLVLVSFDKRMISLYSFLLLSILFSWSETTATVQNLIRSSHRKYLLYLS